MKNRVLFVCLIFAYGVMAASAAFAGPQKSATETYLDDLHSQGKERVVVCFEEGEEVDTSLVGKYGGELVRVFSIINALICEIPQENIGLLEAEESVKSVSPDVILKAQPADEKRDPEEFALFTRILGQYQSRAREDYLAATREAAKEYLIAHKALLNEKTRIQRLYQNTLKSGSKTNMTAADKTSLEAKKNKYVAELRKLHENYRLKLQELKNVYLEAMADAEALADGEATAAYSGIATVRWNNLDAGLNSQAAWNRYGLDGNGVRIAFLDTGVNYNLENLLPSYLGGDDFVEEDGDPLTTDINEDHGTKVVSLSVGRGDNKVVGVAYRANFYAVKVLDTTATGFISDCISGIEWALTEPHKANIISMSLATYDSLSPLWPALKNALNEICDEAYNNGVILVAGSGNSGYLYSGYPAAFNNVISVGGHAEDQTLYDYNGSSSNGGVDILAPGAHVYTVKPDNSAWYVWGTSFATPHAAGLIALQLQYAREHDIQPNNGYLWEIMKHSAVDLGIDPIYQGKGKIYAARTDDISPNRGSMDLFAAGWPLGYDITYSGYAYIDQDGYPAFYIGTNMYQDTALLNNTGTYGSYSDDIENLNVTTAQAYYGEHDEAALPGDSTEEFPVIGFLAAGDNILLEDAYYIPSNTYPGLDRTILSLEFEFAADSLSRRIKAVYPYASIWCPPEVINEGFPIE